MAKKYSPRELKKLVDIATRKASNPALADEEVRKTISELKRLREDYLNQVKEIKKDGYRTSHEDLRQQLRIEAESYKDERERLRDQRDKRVTTLIESALELLNQSLDSRHNGSSKRFEWGLRKHIVIDERQIYTFSIDFSAHIVLLQMNQALREAIGGSPTHKNQIADQLSDQLNRPFDYGLNRIDIRKFFDSIPHDKLLHKIDLCSSLDGVTKVLVRMFLEEFSEISESKAGLPQGISISSFLAEFYLQAFDEHWRLDHRVFFYARYIDDIIMVTEFGESLSDIENQSSLLLQELGLEKHPKKSAIVSVASGGAGDPVSFEYLGYKFLVGDNNSSAAHSGRVKVTLSRNRVAKIKWKIERAFEIWERNQSGPDQSVKSQSERAKLLTDRICYLTSNTKLGPPRNNVVVGIYYSNSSINDDALHLQELDAFLQELVEKCFPAAEEHSRSPVLRRTRSRLVQMSFVNGFLERRFTVTSPSRFKVITRCWNPEDKDAIQAYV